MKVPKRKYLQVGDDAETYDDFDGTTWCADMINDSDVAYVIASDYDALLQENERLREKIQGPRRNDRGPEAGGWDEDLLGARFDVLSLTVESLRR